MQTSQKNLHYKRKIQELTLLFEISRDLTKSIDLNIVINTVLRSMAENMGMHRGTVTLLNLTTEEISIQAAYGLSPSQQERGKYQTGEGITGRVIQTGKPMIVPRISEEPTFLDKTQSRKNLTKDDISFICVPIKLGEEVLGAISADRIFADDISLDEDVRLLSIIGSMIAQAVKLRRTLKAEQELLKEENIRLHEELETKFKPSNIIGNSRAMQKVFDLIAQVSKSDATVLIRGESGTGKELAAYAIHFNSLRAKNPFIKVNCAALPEAIIESELFGHEKGAFTGAVSTRKGRFELADNGTIFLDEIGDLSPATQIKLLRVLQEKEFERVGGMETLRLNVRIITATNRNLESLMENNRFREDLYYRLNVFPIHMPPLKARKTDIMLLADNFIENYNRLNRKSIKRVSTPAIELLTSYHWPGNVRELENCIERAVILSTDNVIHGHQLPPSLQSAESTDTALHNTLEITLENLEKELILDALKSTKGNIAKAARFLGITERKMGIRISKYNIKLNKYHT